MSRGFYKQRKAMGQKRKMPLDFNSSRKPLARLKHALFHLENPQIQLFNERWNKGVRQ